MGTAKVQRYVENENIEVYHCYSTSFFCWIIKHYLKFALDKIWHQTKLLNSEKDVGDCLGSFTNTYGLSYKHILRKHLESGASIQLDSIRPQWHLTIEYPPCPQDCSEDKQFSPRTDIMNHIKGLHWNSLRQSNQFGRRSVKILFIQ